MLNLPVVDYRGRLRRAAQLLNGGTLLVTAQPQGYRNSTVEGIYRQDSLFYYLTGFSETDAALLIRSHRAEGDGRVVLFLRDKDPVAELWNGTRLGVTAAKETLAIDEAYPWESLWGKLPDLLGPSTGIYYTLGNWPDTDRKVVEALKRFRAACSSRSPATASRSRPAASSSGRRPATR